MNAIGEERRLADIFGDTGKALILAIDHDYSLQTGRSGTPNIPEHLLVADRCGADAVLAHGDVLDNPQNRGVLAGGDMGAILQINAATQDSGERAMVSSVDRALRHAVKLDASMVGIQVNFGSDDETKTLQDLARTGEICADLGMPVFVHTYLRKISGGDEYNFEDLSLEDYGDKIEAAIRTVTSLGASVVKVAFRDAITFQRAVETAHELKARAVIAGGHKSPIDQFLINTITAMQLNADGVTIGRNAFARPLGNAEPPLDISAFGPVPSTVSGIDMPPSYFRVPDDEVTVLLALRAIVHGGATDISSALQAVVNGVSRLQSSTQLRQDSPG